MRFGVAICGLAAGAALLAGCAQSHVKTPLHCGTECTFHNLKYKGLTFVSALALSANQKQQYVADYGGSTLIVLSYPKGKFITALGSKSNPGALPHGGRDRG